MTRYERDRSIFALRPAAVIRPGSEGDLIGSLLIAGQHEMPVVARGGGSNTGGAAITDGLLILINGGAFEEATYHSDSGELVAGAGTRHDRIQAALRPYGRWLPSDPSSGPLSCIGGNIATRASGPHALRHGAIHRYVRDLRCVLVDGTLLDTRDPGSVPETILGPLGRLAHSIRENEGLLRELEARRNEKWATGYELLALADHADDVVRALPRLLTGSMGTLGIVTQVVLGSQQIPRGVAASLLAFSGASDACAAASRLREEASAIEFVSSQALSLLREQTDALGDTRSGAILIAEWSGENAAEQAKDAITSLGLTASVSTNEADIAGLWKARKALLPVVERMAGAGLSAYSVVNDVGVHPERLESLVHELEGVFRRRGLVAPVYGHAGNGNLHLRPLFRAEDMAEIWETAVEVYEIVLGQRGCVSPEHGMGRLRAPFLPGEWSADALSSMQEVKRIFDPGNRLNPGVIVAPAGLTDASGTASGMTHGWSIDPVLD